MVKKKIYVTGSDGLVASRFVELTSKKYNLFTPEIDELNILDLEALNTFFEENKPDVCVHFAALTDVNEAEKQRGDKKGGCWQVNMVGTKNLVNQCKVYGVHMILISTDYVFPGTEDNPGPYDEDAPLPDGKESISWYGWSKAAAERCVSDTLPNHSIVRISYPFKSSPDQKVDFAKGILDLFDEGKLYPMFGDQVITPTHIDDLVVVLEKVIKSGKVGVFHAVQTGVTSPYEFASYLIARARAKSNVVQKGSLEEFMEKPGQTPRPVYGGLNNKSTQKRLDVKLRSWKESVDEYVDQMTFKG